jgi:hypothetical protein
MPPMRSRPGRRAAERAPRGRRRGARKMDRPEVGAVNPTNGEIYVTLTNNTSACARSPHRRPQSALLQRPAHRRDRAARQPQRPHRSLAEWTRIPRGPPSAGTCSFRRALHGRRRERQRLGAHRRQRLLEPDGCWFSRRRPALDRDRRRRLYRRHQLHAARRDPGQGRRGGAKTINNSDGARPRRCPTFVRRRLAREKAAAIPRGTRPVRAHRRRGDARRQGALREHPAPGRETPVANIGNPASWPSHWPRRHFAPAFRDARHHPQRRWADRRLGELIAAAPFRR